MAHIFYNRMSYRDFTLCKAVALAGLIGLAAALGGVPHQARDLATHAPAAQAEAQMLPATLLQKDALCDVAKTTGIDL